jgi:pyrimidine-nucleoside phosphorylase
MKTHHDARALAESLVRIGNAFGVRTQAVITAMDWPIGRAVGNANEVIESIETLKGRGPVDLVEESLDLAERMLMAAGVAGDRLEAKTLALGAITSGRAVEKFRAIIERQKGVCSPKLRKSTSSRHRRLVSSSCWTPA